ncbi:hypothetical protein CRENBAI_017896 [Crenichthys baileyi]|uniref:Uncharacterized protein n=1 Tax=Crenichthys baileyi TaxID=28760 RepID=A0AAV9RBE5_9TELE
MGDSCCFEGPQQRLSSLIFWTGPEYQFDAMFHFKSSTVTQYSLVVMQQCSQIKFIEIFIKYDIIKKHPESSNTSSCTTLCFCGSRRMVMLTGLTVILVQVLHRKLLLNLQLHSRHCESALDRFMVLFMHCVLLHLNFTKRKTKNRLLISLKTKDMSFSVFDLLILSDTQSIIITSH